MESTAVLSNYIPAAGPEGLAQVLDDLLAKALRDPAFATTEHYILYTLGNQKSLIKVDLSEKPYQFWYYDLLGRPITGNVKDVIGRFLWEKCGEQERYATESRSS